MGIRPIDIGHGDYPAVLMERLGADAPPRLWCLGDPAIVQTKFIGFVCSIQCPGSIVIKTLDAIRLLRDARVPVIGGFHSPMEREGLDILLRGEQPVVLCPARGLSGLQLDAQAQAAVRDGRLLVLSPFSEAISRANVGQAVERNQLVAALSADLWIPHAAPDGKVWRTVHAALARGQRVLTFVDEANESLVAAGAHSFTAFANELPSR